MKKRILSLFVLVNLLMSATAVAVPNLYTKDDQITNQQINDYLNKSTDFPRIATSNGVTATIFGPEFHINVLNDNARLRVLVSVIDGEQLIVARVMFNGMINYHEYTDTIRFTGLEPRMDGFQIVQDTFQNSVKVVKAIRQGMLMLMRDVVLFDVKKMGLDGSKDIPKSIEISTNKLILHW